MARYEEKVLQLKNVELPIIGDKERVDELVDEELLNNNPARDEEDILQLQNDILPINAAGERAEEVTKADIAVVDKDLENMPAAAKDHVVDEIVKYDEHITEVASEKSDVVIDHNNMMVISFVDHEAGDASSGQDKKRKYGTV